MMLSRLDCEDDQEPEKLQPLKSKTTLPVNAEADSDCNDTTKTEEPNTSQLEPAECK